ncbi:MAG: sugar phosphate isomerase/epimerase [Clostridiales bacterium]|nr:sugar phosphate isomerase/epimerase [Clostridiales bacterium]
MRIGCCTNMHAADGGTGAKHIGLLAELGYDYVELPLAELMALDDTDLSRVRETLVGAGIPCEACNNFFPRHMRLTGPEVDYGVIFAYVKQAVAKASRLGAKIIVFGSGPAKMSPPGFNLSEARDQLVYLLSEISPIFCEAGVTLAIEPLRREECNLINTFSEGCALADAVGAENVRVLVDYYHHSWEREDIRHLAIMGRGRLAHVHFARAGERTFPADLSEDSAYPAFIKALELAGYDARVSIEAYSKSLAEDAAAGLRFMRANFR